MRWLFLVPLVALLACRSGGPAMGAGRGGEGASVEDTALFMRLQRTPCFGTCPVYVITVRQDGGAVYQGGAHAAREGRFTGRLELAQRTALLRRAQELGFFTLEDRYDGEVTDLPSTIITVVAGGRRKQVLGRVGFPPAFKHFRSYADSLFEQVEWTPEER